MRLLQRDFEVETRYGGTSCRRSTASRRARWRPPRRLVLLRQRDRVRGRRRRAPGGAGRPDLVGHHDWGASMRVPAVGSFRSRSCPATRAASCRCGSSASGRRADACDEVETRLRDAGVTDTARSVLEQSAGARCARPGRPVVAAAARHRRAQLEDGRSVGRVRATSEAGDKIDLLDDAGRVDRTLAPAGACSPRRASRPSSRPGSSPRRRARGRRGRRRADEDDSRTASRSGSRGPTCRCR